MKQRRLLLSLTLRALALRLCQQLGLKPSFVYYIGSSEVLPQLLGCRRGEGGSSRELGSGDKSVRNTLIKRNLRLVVYIARKFESSGVAMEDLVSIGTIRTH